MSINAPRTEERTDPRPDYFELGVDKRGARHLCDTTTKTVHIVHPDGSRGRRHLDAGSVDDYMDAVDDDLGWRRREYGVGLTTLLVRSLDQ